MKRIDSVQTKLTDFNESEESPARKTTKKGKQVNPPPVRKKRRKRKKAVLWNKVTSPEEEWAVCNLDDTVLLVRLINGRIHAYGIEAVCKYCGDVLEIREDKIFCGGRCGIYQGEFSRDLDDFLRWEGVKSYTIRKKVAEVEGLNLEPRDLEPISYAPNWSVLEEYEEFPDYDEPGYSTYDSTIIVKMLSAIPA
ncbi:MAG: hypothetical protein ACXAEJ_06320 [Candidatus Thorarchaeota archaeon]|jgi:hypothetical protein